MGKNSADAKKNNQITNMTGNHFSDPRLIKRELEKLLDKQIWQDTERLSGGNPGAQSMFEQIASALSKSKVLVAFVSKDYAESENCKMEFQFAAKSLKKPIVALVVGSAEDDWKNTSVGMIVSQLDTVVDFQKISGNMTFDVKLKQAADRILAITDGKMPRDLALRGIRKLKKKGPFKKKTEETLPGKVRGVLDDSTINDAMD